jgi:hypothetical protein
MKLGHQVRRLSYLCLIPTFDINQTKLKLDEFNKMQRKALSGSLLCLREIGHVVGASICRQENTGCFKKGFTTGHAPRVPYSTVGRR